MGRLVVAFRDATVIPSRLHGRRPFLCRSGCQYRRRADLIRHELHPRNSINFTGLFGEAPCVETRERLPSQVSQSHGGIHSSEANDPVSGREKMTELRFSQLSKAELDEIHRAQRQVAAVVMKHLHIESSETASPRDQKEAEPSFQVIRDGKGNPVGVYIDPPGICGAIK
jgi:hypothetical protein